MFYSKTIETLPLRKLRKLQNERLVALVNRLYKKVPFYKKQLDEAGIKPSKIKGVKDLHK
jgi:phenylacetate-CoA ligase